MALELWDAESWHSLVARQVRFARDTGALVDLQLALNLLARSHILSGELTAAAQLLEEARLIAEAIGSPPVAYIEMMLAAWRGQEAQASELIEDGLQETTAVGPGVIAATYASSVLYNGLGRHDAAREPRGKCSSTIRSGTGPLSCPSWPRRRPGPATSRSVRAALEWLSERTRATPTDWALGIEARVRALLSDGEIADSHYRESIDAPRPYPRAGGTRPFPFAVRRVAATQEPASGRP